MRHMNEQCAGFQWIAWRLKSKTHADPCGIIIQKEQQEDSILSPIVHPLLYRTWQAPLSLPVVYEQTTRN